MYSQYFGTQFPQQMQIQPQFGNQFGMQRQEVVRVSGEDGAKAYQLAPNSSVLLLDENAPIIYLKTTDGGGYPTLNAYSITPYKAPAPADFTSLEERIQKLEEIIHAKPDAGTAQNDT